MPNQPRKDRRRGESFEFEPQARGGGRSKTPRIDEAVVAAIKKKNPHRPEASLRNLKQWQKGESGNPGGKSRSLNDIMRLARSHAPECIERLLEIVRDKNASDRDVIQACIALLDRGCGKAITPVYRGGTNLPIEMIEGSGGDGEFTALLAAAGKGPAGAYRRALVDELARIDAEARAEKQTRRDEVNQARDAMARGEEVSPLLRMLVNVRNETS